MYNLARRLMASCMFLVHGIVIFIVVSSRCVPWLRGVSVRLHGQAQECIPAWCPKLLGELIVRSTVVGSTEIPEQKLFTRQP